MGSQHPSPNCLAKCVHVCIYTHMHVYACVWVQVYMCTCVCACTCVCMLMCTFMCVHVCVYTLRHCKWPSVPDKVRKGLGPAGVGKPQFRPQVALPVSGHSSPSPQFHPGTSGSTQVSSQPTFLQSLPSSSLLLCLLFSKKPLLYRGRDHQKLRVGVSSAQDQREGC